MQCTQLLIILLFYLMLCAQANEDKKMRSYAVIPPLILDARQKRCVFYNENGLVTDLENDFKVCINNSLCYNSFIMNYGQNFFPSEIKSIYISTCLLIDYVFVLLFCSFSTAGSEKSERMDDR